MAEENNNGIISKAAGLIQRFLNLRSDDFGDLSGALMGFGDALVKAVSPFAKVQQEAVNMARAMGMSSKSIAAISERIVAQNKAFSFSRDYGFSSEEMLKIQTSLMKGIGRNVAIGNVGEIDKATGEVKNPNLDSDLENILAASRLLTPEKFTDLAVGFEKIGKSMTSAAKATGKLYAEASDYGISLDKYAENFIGNLDMAQRYNFRNGVDGLKTMARKATEIKQDMSQVASFAEKVGSVTGAVEAAANLQVLGGSFTRLASPLAMLNEGLTDMESLQERLNKMTVGTAVYDRTSRQVKMNPFERMRLRRAAEAMGVDPNNLINQAFAQARRGEILTQMNGIGNLSDDVKKMLPNIGQIDEKTGMAGATVNGEFRSIAELAANPELQKQLIEETRSESDDVKVIAKSVRSIEERMTGVREQTKNELAFNAGNRRSVIGGLTEMDAVTDAIVNGFSSKFISAIGKVEFPLNNIRTNFAATLSKGFNEVFSSLDESTFEEFGKTFRENLTKVLGETEFTDILAGFIENAASAGKAAHDYLKVSAEQANISIERGLENNPSVKKPSSENAHAGTIVRNDEDTRDIINSINANGGGSSVIVLRNSGQESYQFQNAIFTATPQTMQAVTVSENKSATQSTNQGGSTAAQLSEKLDDITINLNGDMTLKVIGDRGVSTEVDIKKLFQDEGFKNDFVNMFREAIKKQENQR